MATSRFSTLPSQMAAIPNWWMSTLSTLVSSSTTRTSSFAVSSFGWYVIIQSHHLWARVIWILSCQRRLLCWRGLDILQNSSLAHLECRCRLTSKVDHPWHRIIIQWSSSSKVRPYPPLPIASSSRRNHFPMDVLGIHVGIFPHRGPLHRRHGQLRNEECYGCAFTW
jgi:hypothetical protein